MFVIATSVISTILFILINLLKELRKSPTLKGAAGELKLSRELRGLAPELYQIIDDVNFNSVNETTEINHIIVSVYCVFGNDELGGSQMIS